MVIRPVEARDAAAWARLRGELWPVEAWTHTPEIEAFFAGAAQEPQAVLVAEDSAGTLIAIAELSIRQDIPGLKGKATGYVEGLYVVPAHRGRGVARSLLIASRDWARAQRCTAFASDRTDRIIVDPKFGNSKSANRQTPEPGRSAALPSAGRRE